MIDVPKRRVIAGDASKIVVIEALLDFFTVCLGTIVAGLLYAEFGLGRRVHYPGWQILLYGIAIACVFVLSLERMRGYGPGSSLLGMRETERVLRATAETFFIFFAFSYVSGFLFSRWVLAFNLLLLPALVLLEKRLFISLAQRLHRFGYEVRRVIAYGAGFTGRRVFSTLCHSPRLGLEPVVIVDPNWRARSFSIFPTTTTASQVITPGPLTRALIEETGADAVIIAIPSMERECFISIVEESTAADINVSFVPTQAMPSAGEIDYADIDGLLLAT